MPSVRLLIKGSVQGVFFRATARDIARKIGITGWVRNTEEGDVETVASGTEEQLERFISWCRQGPPKAEVRSVERNDIEVQAFDSFQIMR